eukprot:CAMPEP_0116833144 /NCGR_PEP_ID=MMETSP0418-20121206/6274_1 /TAXON_ID=1158023 /ORGANISM="Astrosyne radiata, Strain 13vi08-1A" /LENGTH=297 /DNA_ID=CAMNT_0004462563 /DNA_START=32 /DNA_END=922 /DNA_ORIENTATION=+
MAALVFAPEVASLVWCGVTVAASAAAGYVASGVRMRQERKRMQEENTERLTRLVESQAEQLSSLKNRLEDPHLYVENEKKLFDDFVVTLNEMDLQTHFSEEEEDHVYCVGFQGQVSVGKSTMINALFGDKVAKVGKGRTTAEPTKILRPLRLAPDSTRETHIYDLPGHDKEFNYMDMEALRVVNALDLVVAVYDNTIDYTDRLVKLALALGKKVVFVRNKLDDGDEEDELDWKEELERDRRALTEMFPDQNLKIFGISARNAYKAVKHALETYQEQEDGEKQEEPSAYVTPYDVFEW